MAEEIQPAAPIPEISDRRDINTVDIQTLRQSVGWIPDDEAVWQRTLDEALQVSSAYESGQLVGIGFLVGTPRHAVLSDVCVNPENQSGGVGTSIIDSLVDAANEQGVRYVTLTYAEDSPWLEDLYRKCGFEPISNAMQLVRTEDNV